MPLRLADDRPSVLPKDARATTWPRALAATPSPPPSGARTASRTPSQLSVQEGSTRTKYGPTSSAPANPAVPDLWQTNLGSLCIIAEEPLRPRRRTRGTPGPVDDEPWETAYTFTTATA